jgi:hypothetical protein
LFAVSGRRDIALAAWVGPIFLLREALAAQFRGAASRNGTNANALIAQFIADYAGTA